MVRRQATWAGILAGGLALAPIAGVWGQADAPGTFEVARVFFEMNATDEDLGLQLFLDGDGWRRVTVRDPGGNVALDISADGALGELGLTELFFESAEPSPEAVLERFPPGTYRIEGVGVDGRRLEARWTLSHDLPAAPIVSPADGSTLDAAEVVIAWKADVAVERYEVIVEAESETRVLEARLPGSVTSFRVPEGFLPPGTAGKFEVIAVAPNGNKTITEAGFVTR